MLIEPLQITVISKKSDVSLVTTSIIGLSSGRVNLTIRVHRDRYRGGDCGVEWGTNNDGPTHSVVDADFLRYMYKCTVFFSMTPCYRGSHREDRLTMTTHRRHYPKAPILEAVIDIKVNLPNFVFAESPFNESLFNEAGYSSSEKIFSVESSMKFNAAQESLLTTGEAIPIGYRFTDAEKRHILQTRVDGFSLSVLPPYDNWENFVREAKRMWPMYQRAREHDYSTRVAVRYINQIEFPCALEQLNEYLALCPKLPDVPSLNRMRHFFVQYLIPQEDINAMLVINQTPVKSNSLYSDGISVLLDFDLYIEGVELKDDLEVWNATDVLHDRLCSVFESCITEKTRSLIC